MAQPEAKPATATLAIGYSKLRVEQRNRCHALALRRIIRFVRGKERQLNIKLDNDPHRYLSDAWVELHKPDKKTGIVKTFSFVNEYAMSAFIAQTGENMVKRHARDLLKDLGRFDELEDEQSTGDNSDFAPMRDEDNPPNTSFRVERNEQDYGPRAEKVVAIIVGRLKTGTDEVRRRRLAIQLITKVVGDLDQSLFDQTKKGKVTLPPPKIGLELGISENEASKVTGLIKGEAKALGYSKFHKFMTALEEGAAWTVVGDELQRDEECGLSEGPEQRRGDQEEDDD